MKKLKKCFGCKQPIKGKYETVYNNDETMVVKLCFACYDEFSMSCRACDYCYWYLWLQILDNCVHKKNKLDDVCFYNGNDIDWTASINEDHQIEELKYRKE